MQKARRTATILLALLLLFGTIFPVGLAATDIESEITAMEAMKGLSEKQLGAVRQLRTGGDKLGITGFDGEYSLPSGRQKVSVIVEFVSQPAKVAEMEAKASGKRMSFATASDNVRKDHDTFQSELGAVAGGAYEITAVYTEALSGMAVTLPADSVSELAELDCVYAVYPDRKVTLDPREEPVYTYEDEDRQISSGMANSRDYLGIDALHESGYTGAGVKIGIIDTGVDYNHPDLAGAFAYDERYGKYGRDLAQDIPGRDPLDPMETTYDEWLNWGSDIPSYLYITSHGTHVAGIAAGRGINSPLSTLGIAPEATLVAYRVLGAGGWGWDSWILSALDYVGPDGCDVVNMSLGKGINDTFDPVAVAVNNVTLAYDIVFSLAAGNDGPATATLGSPAGAPLAITVANSALPSEKESIILRLSVPEGYSFTIRTLAAADPSNTVSYSDDGYAFNAPDIVPNEDGTYNIVFIPSAYDPSVPVGFGHPEDYTDEIKEKLAGNIAVVAVNQNLNSLYQQKVYAEQAGAAALIVAVLPDEGIYIEPPLRADSIPLYYSFDLLHTENLPTEGTTVAIEHQYLYSYDAYLSIDSSLGPAQPTYEIKPDITAPGTLILSTVPYFAVNPENRGEDRYDFAYDTKSGTSMAAPHIAGVAALMLQAEPGMPAYEVKARMMNSADPGYPGYSVFEIGAGLVRPAAAINTQLYATVNLLHVGVPGEDEYTHKIVDGIGASLSFGNMYPGQTSTLSATIHNTSSRSSTYTIGHFFNRVGNEVVTDDRVTLSYEDLIQVDAGAEASVSFSFELPSDDFAAGSYEGYVHISDGRSDILLPFGAYVKSTLPVFAEAYLDRPLLAAGDRVHVAELSNSSGLCFSLNQSVSTIQYYVLNEKGEYVGESKYFWSVYARTGEKAYINHMLFPEVYDWNYEDHDWQAVPLEPGSYTLCLTASGGIIGTDTAFYELPFIVDGAPPAVSGLDVTRYEDEALITGNVFDQGIADLVEKGITRAWLRSAWDYEANRETRWFEYGAYDMSSNFVMLEYNGELYGNRPDSNGDFAFYVPITGTDGEQTGNLYLLDHFMQSYIDWGYECTSGLSLELPCFYDYSYTNGPQAMLGANVSDPIPVDLGDPLPYTRIRKARKQPEGSAVTIRGTATTNSQGADPLTSFIDCIFVQDDTYAGSGIRVAGLDPETAIWAGNLVELTGTIQVNNDGDVELLLTEEPIVLDDGRDSHYEYRQEIWVGPPDLYADHNALFTELLGVVTYIQYDDGKISKFILESPYDNYSTPIYVVIDENIGPVTEEFEEAIQWGILIGATGVVTLQDGEYILKLTDLSDTGKRRYIFDMNVTPSIVPAKTAAKLMVEFDGYNLDLVDKNLRLRLFDSENNMLKEQVVEADLIQYFTLPGDLEPGRYELSLFVAEWPDGHDPWHSSVIWVGEEPVEATVAQARNEIPYGFVTLQGIAMTGTQSADPNTSFKDSFYLQDETGGIRIHNYSDNLVVNTGEEIRVTGLIYDWSGSGENSLLLPADECCEILNSDRVDILPLAKETDPAGSTADEENKGWFVSFLGFVGELFRSGSDKITDVYVRDSADDPVYSGTYVTIDENIAYPGSLEPPAGTPALDRVLSENNYVRVSGFVNGGLIRVSNLEHIVDVGFPVVKELTLSPDALIAMPEKSFLVAAEWEGDEKFEVFGRLEGVEYEGAMVKLVNGKPASYGNPPSAGNYEFVLYTCYPGFEDEYIRLTAKPVPVKMMPENVNMSFTPGKLIVNREETLEVTVTWDGEGDVVHMEVVLEKGNDHGPFAQLVDGKANLTVKPPEAGDYELVLYVAHPGTGEAHPIARETITAVALPENINMSVSPDKLTVNSRETLNVTLSWDDEDIDAALFVALVKGASQIAKADVTDKKASFSVTPTETGDYELVLYAVHPGKEENIELKRLTITASSSGSSGGAPPAPSNSGGSVIITEPEIPLEAPDYFDDDNGHWAEERINKLAALDFISGVGDRIFAPDAPVTRAQYVQMIYNIFAKGEAAGTDNPFSDVENGEWYEAAVLWAYNKGIVAGYPDGTFRPGQVITREEIAVVTATFCEVYGIELPNNPSEPFIDASDIAEFASDRVEELRVAGIITGRPGGAFDPKGRTTRAEAITLLEKIYQGIQSEE